MRKTRVLFILATALILPLSAMAARPNNPPLQRLYTLDTQAQPEVRRDLVPDGIEEFLLEVNPAAVAANPGAFVIDLPDSPPLVAVRTRFFDYRPDWKSWFGTLRYADPDGHGTKKGFIHLGYHGGQITAILDFADERYRIAGGLGESHRLVRLSSELSPPPCGLETEDDPNAALESGGKDALREDPVFRSLTLTRLDVLAIYPRAFFTRSAAVESGLFTFIQDSISLANNAFANSGVNATYNLVGIVPVLDEYQPTNGLFDSLNWVTNQLTMEVQGLRSAFGADILTIYLPFEWNEDNYCGVANRPQAGGGFSPYPGSGSFGQRAFSVNRNGCGLNDFTLGHEIGHNYGMQHDIVSSGDLGLFDYGRGYVLTVSGQPKATVMGCACGSTGLPACGTDIANSVCGRIPYFSNPAVSYLGVATGVSPSGNDPGRNNALVASNQVGTYAGFYPQSSNTPPTANFSVSCTGKTCTFNAGSSTDNVTLPLNTYNYRWDFGDGTIGEGKVINHTYASAGTRRVHLVVFDSGHQTDVVWKNANPL